MNQEAVLDRETGLVWQRSPFSAGSTAARSDGINACLRATTGGRQGWRLPRVDELMTLADVTNTDDTQVHLPAGHPFLNIPPNSSIFWAADHIPAPQTDSGHVLFFTFSGGGAGLSGTTNFQLVSARAWCVRAPTSNGANTR
jgi:hypothetical protein